MDKKHRPAIVYQAINAINGNRYIGITCLGLETRRRQHLSAARRGYKGRFYNAIRKYGENNFTFTVLHHTESYEKAIELEIKLITYLRPAYNVTSGGEGVAGIIFSPERLRHMSEIMKGRPGTFLGRRHSEESKEKMRLSHLGKPGPWKGRKRPADTTEKIRQANLKNPARYWLGKKRDQASIEKMRRSKTGVPRKPVADHILAIFAENMRRAARNRRIPVRCLNDSKVFESAKSASEYYGLNKSSITSVCFGRRTSVFGYRFEYVRKPCLQVDSTHSTQPSATSSSQPTHAYRSGDQHLPQSISLTRAMRETFC